MDEASKRVWLTSRGWHTWYHPDYWVHKRYGSESRDYTNWGMGLEKAYKIECELDAAT